MKKVKNHKSSFDIFKCSSKQSKTYHATVPLTQTQDFSQVCFPVLVLMFKFFIFEDQPRNTCTLLSIVYLGTYLTAGERRTFFLLLPLPFLVFFFLGVTVLKLNMDILIFYLLQTVKYYNYDKNTASKYKRNDTLLS